MMNEEMIIRGVIIHSEKIESGVSRSGKQWTKQGAVVETQGRYPRTVYFTMFGERIPVGGVQVGSAVEVAVEVNSREYNGKWYTNVTAYRLSPLTSGSGGPMGHDAGAYPRVRPSTPPQQVHYGQDGDPLPF